MSFTDKQLEAGALLSNPNKTRCLLYGGVRSGKSYTIAKKLWQRAHEFAGTKQVIFRKTMADARDTFWLETMLPILKNDEAGGHCTIYKQPPYAEYKNGSIIRVGGLHPSEIDKALGVEYGTIFVNEASETSWRNVPVLLTRLNDRSVHHEHGGQIVPKLIVDCNPPTTNHWLHKAFILKQSPEDGKPLNDADAWGSLQINPMDNKPNLAKDFLSQIEGMSERDKQRFYYGNFGQTSGLIYDNFDPEKHIIDDLTELPSGRIYRAIDFGFVHPFVCLWFVITDDETVIVFKERSVKGITIDIHAQDIIEQSKGMNIENTCTDHDAGEREMLNRAGISTIRADKNVSSGIDGVYSLLERGKLKITRSCKNTINGFYSYTWKEKSIKSEPKKENDDEMDALRYGIKTFLLRDQNLITADVVGWL